MADLFIASGFVGNGGRERYTKSFESNKAMNDQFDAMIATIKESLKKNKRRESTITELIRLIFSSVIGVYAAMLSWDCNTKMGYTVPVKLVCAFFAFMFGLLFLVFYLIFRSYVC